VRVVIGQFSAGLDAATNREIVSAIGVDAAAHEPDLLVLPEAAMHDFGPPTLSLASVAEPLDGPFVQTLASVARSLRSFVVAGMFEVPGLVDGPPYNTVVVIDPEGAVRAAYRKLHLYDAYAYRESQRLAAGTEDPPIIEIGGMAVGISTCYDLRFPEIALSLALRDAQAMVVPAAWVRGPGKETHWQTLLTARAIENSMYVLGAAQCGRSYCGLSTAVDPTGQVVGQLGADASELLVVDLEPADVARARHTNPSLKNRRYAAPALEDRR
jgi:predicted amidohydrolase